MTERMPAAVPKIGMGTFPSVNWEETIPKTPLAMNPSKMANIATSMIMTGSAGRIASTSMPPAHTSDPPKMTFEGEPTAFASKPKTGPEARVMP